LGWCRTCARTANYTAARLRLSVWQEAGALIVNVFHGVVRTPRELLEGPLYPKYLITLDQFEACVTYYLRAGYRAVCPADLIAGLPPGGRSVMFSFDDGYANNRHILPVLERHRVPAVFALTTDNVAYQRPYWWDVVFRRERDRGLGLAEIYAAIDSLAPAPVGQTREALAAAAGVPYGEGVLACLGEEDRPLRPEEVTALARHP